LSNFDYVSGASEGEDSVEQPKQQCVKFFRASDSYEICVRCGGRIHRGAQTVTIGEKGRRVWFHLGCWQRYVK
jgi:hypothetical protein